MVKRILLLLTIIGACVIVGCTQQNNYTNGIGEESSAPEGMVTVEEPSEEVYDESYRDTEAYDIILPSQEAVTPTSDINQEDDVTEESLSDTESTVEATEETVVESSAVDATVDEGEGGDNDMPIF